MKCYEHLQTQSNNKGIREVEGFVYTKGPLTIEQYSMWFNLKHYNVLLDTSGRFKVNLDCRDGNIFTLHVCPYKIHIFLSIGTIDWVDCYFMHIKPTALELDVFLQLSPKLYVYITIRFVPSTAHSVGSYARCHFMCLSSNILSDTWQTSMR